MERVPLVVSFLCWFTRNYPFITPLELHIIYHKNYPIEGHIICAVMCGNVRRVTLRWNCFLAVLRVTKCDLWPGDMDKFSKLLKLQNPLLGILWEFRNNPLTYVFQPHETVCKEATLMAGGWLLDDMCLDTNDSRIGSPHYNCRLSNTK